MDDNNSLASSTEIMTERNIFNDSNIRPHEPEKKGLHTESCDPSSPIGQVYDLMNEASRIVQMELEKDFALLEKDKIIQDSEETVDNLQKNIMHLQMEYEQLDQNYQKEISYRTEVLQRMDTTRNMIESAAGYTNILTVSIKQLEDDKYKIAEFYNDIHRRQEEVEEKRKEIDGFLKEQNDLIEKCVRQALATKEKTAKELIELTSILSQTQNDLTRERQKKLELEEQLEKIKDDLNTTSLNLKSEQAARIKFQVMKSNLKKLINKQEYYQNKIYNSWKTLSRKRVKVLKEKVKCLQNELDQTKRSILNYLSTIEDLNKKISDLTEELKKVSENNIKEINEMNEKLNICTSEKDRLSSDLQDLKLEIQNQQFSKDILIQENEALANEKKILNSNLEKRENEIQRMLEENFIIKEKIEELTSEIHSKSEVINNLENRLKRSNTEELTEMMKVFEEKLLKYESIEKEFENHFHHLNEAISKESDMEEKLWQQQIVIEGLENDMAILKAESEKTQNELHVKILENSDLKNGLMLKTAEIERITSEFKSKIEGMHDDEEYCEIKNNLLKEKFLNEELARKIKNLEDENLCLNRNLVEATNAEKSLSKTLEFEKRENDEKISKLKTDIECGEKLLKVQEEKLQRADEQLQELKTLQETLKTNEETIANLKKLLASSEANVEAYKIVVKRLEEGASNMRITESKEVRSEADHMKHKSQKVENLDKLLYTPKGRNCQKGNEGGLSCENDDDGFNTLTRTPTRSRRLLSTPVRLRGSFPSPNFKSISPVLKNHDPYEFDSDSSNERPRTSRIFGSHKSIQKRGANTKHKQ